MSNITVLAGCAVCFPNLRLSSSLLLLLKYDKAYLFKDYNNINHIKNSCQFIKKKEKKLRAIDFQESNYQNAF